MAVLVDDFNSSSVLGSLAAITIPHTCSGSDRLLHVAFSVDSTTQVDFQSGDIKYAGVDLTFVNQTADDGVSRQTAVFRLIAPTLGINNMVASWPVGSGEVTATVISFTGANQSTPTTGSAADEGNGDAISIPSITSTADDLVVGYGYLNNLAIGDISEGTGQTPVTSFGAAGVQWVSSKAGAAGTQSLSWSVTSQAFGAVGVSIAPAGPPPPSLTIDNASYADGETIGFAVSNFDNPVDTYALTDTFGNEVVTTGTQTTADIAEFLTQSQLCLIYGEVTLEVSNALESAIDTFELTPQTGVFLTETGTLVTPAVEGMWSYNSVPWSNPILTGDPVTTSDTVVTIKSNGEISYPIATPLPYTFDYKMFSQLDGGLTLATMTLEAEPTGDPSLTLPFPLGSTSGVAAAESNVPVSVCTASDMVQVYSGVVSWGSDGVVPSITDAVFVPGIDYSIAIEGSFMAKFTVTAV